LKRKERAVIEFPKITKRVITSTKYEYELFGSIEEHYQYDMLRNDLYSATENDSFLLKINSPGGIVSVGAMIVKAIEESKATVVSRVIYSSDSMASVIALACDGMIMDRHTVLMFHTYSSEGASGKSNELIPSVQSAFECITGQFNDILSPFLTDDELRRMYNGEDIRVKWNDRDLKQRIKRHFPLKVKDVI
jgi:ATP-dependent protease ClpP protease subunit